MANAVVLWVIVYFCVTSVNTKDIMILHGQNNLTLNPDKTTCTLFPPDHAECKSNLDLKINTTHDNAPKYYGLYLRPKTYLLLYL